MTASSSFARSQSFPTVPNGEESSGTLAESLTDALVECIKALGGSKVVGHRLWPEKAVDAAQRHLLACLNDSKPERLNPDQVLAILAWAKQIGFHGGMRFIAYAAGYAEPVPVAPKDEADDLRRQFIESTRQLARMAERIEQLERTALRAA